MQRRAIGGTVAKKGAVYLNKGGASAISDLAGHTQENGQLLGGPYFPRIYPTRVQEEEELRAQGGIVGRDPKKDCKHGGKLGWERCQVRLVHEGRRQQQREEGRHW